MCIEKDFTFEQVYTILGSAKEWTRLMGNKVSRLLLYAIAYDPSINISNKTRDRDNLNTSDSKWEKNLCLFFPWPEFNHIFVSFRFT
jgi:hypothetical protein